MKKIIVTEKPSVAMTYASVLKVSGRKNGYIENDEWIITWCIGHLVEMCYPDKYMEALKEWVLETLPFLPEEYKYEVIPDVAEQFRIIKSLYNRRDIATIYYAGDSAREGVYIQALVRQMAGHNPNAKELIVWIDSQTPAEIHRGIRDAADYCTYQQLIDSGYQRAIEDYAVGINFTRGLSVKYGYLIRCATGHKVSSITVGRVMTCVLGMVVRRELEIRNFKPIPFYKVAAIVDIGDAEVEAEWKITENSLYYNDPKIYENTGFKEEKDATAFISSLPDQLILESKEETTEVRKAPPLFNLAELQSECTKILHISPDSTLKVAQSLYEKKLITYPRSDARVLTTAVADGIDKVISGLTKGESWVSSAANEILSNGWDSSISRQKKYVDDSKVNDHYAVIPTGINPAEALTGLEGKVYQLILKRFLSIFYPGAEYEVVKLTFSTKNELFRCQYKLLSDEGYYKIAGKPETKEDPEVVKKQIEAVAKLQEDQRYPASYQKVKGETSTPRRYTSGSMILAMENAGNLIEDEELRAQIQSCGIGTSATRAAIIDKLVKIKYLNLNAKTQILTPERAGFMVYEIVLRTIPALLEPRMTASWEKGLDAVANGRITTSVYQNKMEEYVRKEITKLKEEDMSKELEKAIRKHAENPNFKVDTAPFERKDLNVKCPICGGVVQTRPFGYACEHYKKDTGCAFAIGTIAGVSLKEYDVEALVNDGRTRVIEGFTPKKGKTLFSAALTMEIEDDKPKIAFDFSDVTTPTLKGCKCPKCGGKMEIYQFGYRCENNHGQDDGTCDFFIGKIAGKKLTEKQATQLLQKRKTELIQGFKNKEGRKFDAMLAIDRDGKISFEFPERKPAEESGITCPKCGKTLMRDEYKYSCECGYKIKYVIAHRKLTEQHIAGLIEHGRSAKIDGFTSKKGKRFSAVLKCNENGEISFEFD